MLDIPAVHIGLLILDLHIPESGSLKSKRSVINSLKERLKSKFNVSICELGNLDKWQRTTLGVVTVSNDKKHTESSISSVLSFVETVRDATLIDTHIEYL